MASSTQAPAIADLYDVLGVKPCASSIEIQRAFRKILRAWGARAKSGIGAVIMAAANEAYETLKNPEKKKYYDAEYPSIKKAWKKYTQRKMIAAQADDDDVISDDSSDLDDADDDEMNQDGDEKADDEDDTDDGGPDGEAEDHDYTDRESSDNEIVVAIRPRNSVVVVDSEDDQEPDAEFTDGEEPESDDDAMDESVDRYADYCTGYAEDTDSSSESDSEVEGHYAIQLRSGKWVDRHEHYANDPDHETCELDEED